MAERTPEQEAAFARAVDKVRGEEPLARVDEDALSDLTGPDLEQLHGVWAALPAGGRGRLLRALRDAAEQRLSLDYSPINHLGLTDAAAEVRLAAVQAGLEDQSDALLESLADLVRRDPSPEIRRAAAEELGRFALLSELEALDADAAGLVRATLFGVLRQPEEEAGVRSRALAALGYLSDAVVIDELASGFRDPDLRWGAVRGMGRSADPRWTDRLLPVLGSEDADMRAEAARALGEIEDERAVRPLAEVIDDPDVPVRLAAIKALGAIGGEEAREALFYLLEDPDEAIREAAERAMQEMEFYEDPMAL